MQVSFKTKKGEGSFKGVNMTWSISNFKSPLGSLTEEYGNWFQVDLLCVEGNLLRYHGLSSAE